MEKRNIISIEERIPKLKQMRKRKTNRRLAFVISMFFLLVMMIIYFQSPFSRVQHIKVAGNQLTSDEEIIQRSGMKKGISVWKVNKEQAEAKLERDAKIQQAKVSFSFPNKYQIQVKEQNKLAYLSKGKRFHPVLANGAVLRTPATGTLEELPILYEFKNGRELDLMMRSLQELPREIVNAISEIYYAPKKTDHQRIQLFMNDGYEVSATLATFSEKMKYYPSIVSQLDPRVKGVIHIEVGSYFKPYGSEKADEQEELKLEP
ncbi:cell division protein FtsQ/DivIB [Bacillus xiapuensis]|uniref:cell division protein FtsQ/DivIB n=1 Tax=Bacillus xiapuensis TaxID=2014075 RepID=UPI000C23D6ED|nr:cell division protein FtsQ/DivIB [Bacillus xiapuensis]